MAPLQHSSVRRAREKDVDNSYDKIAQDPMSKLSKKMTLRQFTTATGTKPRSRDLRSLLVCGLRTDFGRTSSKRRSGASSTMARSRARRNETCHGQASRTSTVGSGSTWRVILYTNDRDTKAFLEREARRLDPAFKRRSGSRYRLNRWREAQLTRGARITYRDLVKEYMRLNSPETTYRRVPSGRYIYFLSDFMAANPGARMAVAIRAWKTLKRMDSPKDYRAFNRTRDKSHKYFRLKPEATVLGIFGKLLNLEVRMKKRPILAAILMGIGCLAGASAQTQPEWTRVEEETIRHFQALLRLDTSSPPGNESRAADYLEQVLESEGIPVRTFVLEPGRANLVARLKGNGRKRPLLSWHTPMW